MDLKSEYFKSEYFKSFLSLIGILFFLCLTWFYFFYEKKNFDENFHLALQRKSQEAIGDYIEKNYPHIIKVNFHQIWTEKTDSSQLIKIFFHYSIFVDRSQASGKTILKGEAFLKQDSVNPSRWMMQDFKIKNAFLDFEESLKIQINSDNNQEKN